MPRLSKTDLRQVIVEAYDAIGTTAVFVDTQTATNPQHLIVQSVQGILDTWLYIWTLTHGGGAARPQNEYRIQMTGVSSPLKINPTGFTVLIGYEPNLSCFAGFDLTKHTTFMGFPSTEKAMMRSLSDFVQTRCSAISSMRMPSID